MKHTIQQERLMKVMEKYFYDLYPDFELPLKEKRTSTRVSYRSKMVSRGLLNMVMIMNIINY
jgi:hypothetical protein